MDFSPMLPLCVILVILLVLNRFRKNRHAAPTKNNVKKLQANCSILMPNNQVEEAYLIRRGDEDSVVYTEAYGRMTVPNHCLRFIGSLRELNIKKPFV